MYFFFALFYRFPRPKRLFNKSKLSSRISMPLLTTSKVLVPLINLLYVYNLIYTCIFESRFTNIQKKKNRSMISLSLSPRSPRTSKRASRRVTSLFLVTRRSSVIFLTSKSTFLHSVYYILKPSFLKIYTIKKLIPNCLKTRIIFLSQCNIRGGVSSFLLYLYQNETTGIFFIFFLLVVCLKELEKNFVSFKYIKKKKTAVSFLKTFLFFKLFF